MPHPVTHSPVLVAARARIRCVPRGQGMQVFTLARVLGVVVVLFFDRRHPRMNSDDRSCPSASATGQRVLISASWYYMPRPVIHDCVAIIANAVFRGHLVAGNPIDGRTAPTWTSC